MAAADFDLLAEEVTADAAVAVLLGVPEESGRPSSSG
jgi:hypothetical protein